MALALYKALSGDRPMGAPSIQSVNAPIPPAAVPPSTPAGPSLYHAMVADNTPPVPRDDIPDPNKKNSEDFARGMATQPPYLKDFINKLLGNGDSK